VNLKIAPRVTFTLPHHRPMIERQIDSPSPKPLHLVV
jgi:hypothetical protein